MVEGTESKEYIFSFFKKILEERSKSLEHYSCELSMSVLFNFNCPHKWSHTLTHSCTVDNQLKLKLFSKTELIGPYKNNEPEKIVSLNRPNGS